MNIVINSWREFSTQVYAWAKRNFGVTDPLYPIAGIVEELAEFTSAFYVASRNPDCEECKDGMADCMVYIGHYCGMREFDLDEIIGSIKEVAINLHMEREFIIAAGNLCHGQLKLNQNIRQNEDHDQTIRDAITSIIGLFFYMYSPDAVRRITGEVWSKVSQRDWKKNKETGLAVDAT